MVRTANFVGDGSLLIECAELFVAGGGTVNVVLSGDERVLAWAKDNGFALAGTASEPEMKDQTADFLFSVANLNVLPASVLASAKMAAINFHDGPLPGYSGLNVTSWAILAGETRHAVTWHEMTTRVDAGRVLVSREFDIAPDETAFSLNTKCFAAGAESFSDLLEQVFSGNLAGTAQSGARHWFGKDKRPENYAVLDFTKPAASLSALVRALDFGPYANTLTTAKLWTGGRLFVVRHLELLGQATGKAGLIQRVDEDRIVVCAGDFDVVLRKLETLDGSEIRPSACGLAVGTTLPAFAFGQFAGASSKTGAHWAAVLAASKPVPLPFARNDGTENRGYVGTGFEVAENLPIKEVTAGFAVWLGLLSGETEFALSLAFDGAESSPDVRGDYPVSIGLDAETSVETLVGVIEQSTALAQSFGPMSAELLACLPAGATRQHAADVLVGAAVTCGEGSKGTAGHKLVLALQDGFTRLEGRADHYSEVSIEMAARSLADFLTHVAERKTHVIGSLQLSDLADLAGPPVAFDHLDRIESAFRDRAKEMPSQMALEAGGVALTFAELDARSDILAGALAAKGAKKGTVIGLCLPRSSELVVAMLAILKTGAAYLPLDPEYPVERVKFMVADSGAPLVIAGTQQIQKFALDAAKVLAPNAVGEALKGLQGASGDLAYLIYTSGSTGTPKGVMVSHANVTNFMAGMDKVVPHKAGDRLLAVTSISFDISVLEIFWTLTRGITVILQTDGSESSESPSFSLFYFASEAAGSGHHAYRLLLEGAKFADENGFEAVWTPERHFHAFGGLYPNPAVASAMVAGITKKVKIRAGSIVLPLHHPVRAAEDWALVDNLSGGRAGMAIASGWQPNDFILQPQNFDNRKDVMLESIDTLRALWRGEAVEFPNHKGEMIKTTTLPRPVQSEIPMWITAAGNPETFAAAARKGCGVLTHLLGQTFDEVAEKIRAYRVAWVEAGHPGTGTVTLMLHTFVGDNDASVRETVRLPMRSYLKSAVDLIKRASWSFPTFVQKADASGMTPQQVFEEEELSKEETDALLDHAFDRYYRDSGLFGTPESCVEIVRKVAAIGVDEIACLIDFGVDTDLALAHLQHIKTLMNNVKGAEGVSRKASVAEHIVENGITHLQCTPSAASMLMADAPGRTALARLHVLLVGGEALPPDLAHSLRKHVPGVLLNMYGPTETTVWSSVARLDEIGETVPLGKAIANTFLSVRNDRGQTLPEGIAGELWIGGDGVSLGYWQRPDLTADRFLEPAGNRFYRSGDLVRREGDVLEFLGRIDNQVKIRGHRIELGEIEAKLSAMPNVRQGVVVAQTDSAGENRLVGYCVANPGMSIDPKTQREALAEVLPDFMVPSMVVVLERFMTTPNGKIDRKALASPSTVQISENVEATGDTQEAIAEIWREALGLAHVSTTDNFFDLGGHSLLVVQVQRRLKQKFGKEIPIVDMFRYSTIQSLAERVDGDVDSDNSAAKRGQERAMTRRNRAARRMGS